MRWKRFLREQEMNEEARGVATEQGEPSVSDVSVMGESRSGNWHAFRMSCQPHFSPFKFYINRGKGTALVLNPKVGTQTIRHVLNRGLREVLGYSDPSEGRYRIFNKAREFPFARLRDYVHALTRPGDYEFYCFVRNPYSRLRSAWLDKFAFGHESSYPLNMKKRVIGPMRKFARRFELPGAEDGSAIPFGTFVSYVERGKPGHRDHHWDEQRFVLLTDYIRYSRTFKLETEFREGMVQVLARIGLERPWVEEALRQPRNESRKCEEALYDKEIAARVHRIYERDFELFGYDPESWRGL